MEAAAGFKLPHNAKLMAQPVLFDALQRHRVLQCLDRIVGAAAPEALLLHIRDDPVGTSHGHKLADVRHLSRGSVASRLYGRCTHRPQPRGTR